MLTSKEDVGSALKNLLETDCDNDAIIIAKAAKIVRRDLLSLERSSVVNLERVVKKSRCRNRCYP